MEKDLRKHHWRLNHNNKHSWKTYYKQRHGDKSKQADKSAYGKAKELTMALRRENFKVGNFGDEYNTMSRSNFRDALGKPAKLD